MHWVDIVILCIIGLSMVISILRGLIREVLSLVAWVAAVWAAVAFGPAVQPIIAGAIEMPPSVSRLAAFLLVFLGALIVLALVNFMVSKLIKASGLSSTDRALGSVFGLARGIAIVVLLVLVAGLLRMPLDPWWREPRTLPTFERLAKLLVDRIPADYAVHFHFEPAVTPEASIVTGG